MQDNTTTTDKTSQPIFISLVCTGDLFKQIQSLIDSHLDDVHEMCIDTDYYGVDRQDVNF